MEAWTRTNSISRLKVWVKGFLFFFYDKHIQDLCAMIISIILPEPPVPTTAPKLLEKRSKQLLVKPVDSHRGDGPITSTKVLYMPAQNANSWSSIIGKRADIPFGKCHWVGLILEVNSAPQEQTDDA